MAKKDTKLLQYKIIHIRLIYQQKYSPRGLRKTAKKQGLRNTADHAHMSSQRR